MQATNVQWGKRFVFFSCFVGCIFYTAKKAYSSPARYIFSVTNYFDVSQVFVDDYNDNCPYLQDVNIALDLEPIPPLQTAAFFTAYATDKDSGVNGQIRYQASSPVERM